MDEFEEKWDHKNPRIGKNKGPFPSDSAATKLFYLALRNAAQKWTMPLWTWKQALNLFSIFNILKMENNKAVTYTEDRIRPLPILTMSRKFWAGFFLFGSILLIISGLMYEGHHSFRNPSWRKFTPCSVQQS
ncbi:MAG: hypothetical protein JKY17_03965 [Magnetovibrio sp.]|nr:hypothetical protein [Magnetovibrio sp.]